MMDPQYGLVNVVLRFFGGPTPNWFGSEHMAFATITVMSVWSVGPLVVIFLAGLQGIPRELYEQAEIDGAQDAAPVDRRHPADDLAGAVVQPGDRLHSRHPAVRGAAG